MFSGFLDPYKTWSEHSDKSKCAMFYKFNKDFNWSPMGFHNRMYDYTQNTRRRKREKDKKAEERRQKEV